jgi:uncharacterized membrane protein YbhN (UPF0104 family)
MPRLPLGRLAKPLFIVFAIVCLLLAVQRGFKGAAALPAPNLPTLALAVALFLIHYLLQALGWHGILRALGERASLRVSLRMWYMSLIARWLPGRIWYSATRLYLAREAGLSVSTVTFAMVFELLYILLGGTIATILFAGAQMQGVLTGGQAQSVFALIVLVIFVAAALVLNPGTLLRMYQMPLFRKAMRRVAGGDISQQNPPSMRLGSSLGLVCYYTVFWIYSGVAFGVLASAFIPMASARWLACIPAFPGSWLIGFFSIVTPAGLVAREGAMWLMLKPVMPQSQALILALASRLIMIGAETLSVALVYIFLRGAVRVPLSVGGEQSS